MARRQPKANPPPEVPPEVPPEPPTQLTPDPEHAAPSRAADIGGPPPELPPATPGVVKPEQDPARLVLIKRTLNSPHHLRRRGADLDEVTARRLREGRVPSRRFTAGARLRMTAAERGRYGLREGFDYRFLD